MTRIVYHAQEDRGRLLSGPIICQRDDAWFGNGYYFWISEEDGIFWGNTSKKKTGKYHVYSCNIDCEDILDTVFNEEHYLMWIRQIEKIAEAFIKKTGLKPTLKEINDLCRDKGVFNGVDGIMFQDISKNPVHFLVEKFQYKKRIQIALFNKAKLSNFASHFKGHCN